MSYLKKLNSILTKNDKYYLFYLFIFSIFIALIETIGVSIVMPYISMANDFSIIETNSYSSSLFNLFNFSSYINFLLVFGGCIIVFYFLRALLNTLYMFLVMRFTFTRYHNIINKLFKNYLKRPYKEFIQTNTSQLTKIIVNEATYLTELIKATLILFSEVCVFVLIYSILLYINYEIIIGITLIILVVGWVLVKTVSSVAKQTGRERESNQKFFYEILNKSFSNIKMLKLQDMDSSLVDFFKVSKLYTRSMIVSTTIQHVPRLSFEFVGFSIVVGIVMFLLYQHDTDISTHYGTITIFVLGLYRLLPSITKILTNYNHILFYYQSLDLIYKDYFIKLENIGADEIIFNSTIEINNIDFNYEPGKNILKSCTLEIKKNDKIAFIGESGSGKSTLVDIIMGLHKVSKGKILIDNVELSENNLFSWRNHFGYIPQSVYLFDGTVAENVAFGLDIDNERIIEVLKQANIWTVLESKNGIDTKVGESGVMLSGGQKQRIAIARALYKNPDILVLDEATSALDDDTEEKIMDEIYSIVKNKTLIIIAHRLSTIRRCDKVYEIKNGKVKTI